MKIDSGRYATMIKQDAPKSRLGADCLNAFWTGGLLCVIAQCIFNGVQALGSSKAHASVYSSLGLIVIAALLTMFNVFDKIGSFAGAGTLVPITGFANAVVSAGMEFRTEGLVFGTGGKIFSIAGPVVVYGTVFSAIYGLIYLLFLR